MMCQSAEDFKSQAKWDGANGNSRSQLLSELSSKSGSFIRRCLHAKCSPGSISPSVMIPEHRLAELLREVKDGWIQNCSFHNTAESPSLYVDHMCTCEDFPTTCNRIFADHTDEVWYLAYSNDGTKLATASKDQTVNIYSTTDHALLHTLPHEDAGVCYVAWSYDDTKLLTCTREQDNSARVWDVRVSLCL
jgi:WD40 repeat protein